MKYRVKKQWPGWPSVNRVIDLEKDSDIEWYWIKNWFDVYLEKHQLDEYFEPVKEKPMSWEDLDIDWYYVTSASSVFKFWDNIEYKLENKNTRPTKEMAEAQLALSQLMQLRDVWRDGWKPIGIMSIRESVRINIISNWKTDTMSIPAMSFQNKKTCDLFQETFKDLIDKIKPLYFS